MFIGYARVSTADQRLDLHIDALTKAGCDRIFTDHASGGRGDRVGLADALSHLRAGDTLVVWKLDLSGARSGRSSTSPLSLKPAAPTSPALRMASIRERRPDVFSST
jgi:DNA invertase Pin-like site-specific DNA recombinase